MKNTLFALAFLLSGIVSTNAQSDSIPRSDWKFLGNIQYVTQHYWRGLGKGPLFGEAPAFEPSISFYNKHWNIGVFAGGSFDGIYKTVMPWINYSPAKDLWIGLWDIYSPGRNFWNTNPFDFGTTTSKHFVDLMVTYQLPWFPLSLKAATVVFGGDPNADGNKNYTTYLETSYQHRWGKFSAWGGIGVTPWKGLYASRGGINNLELKLQYNFRLYQPVTMPVFTKIAYNPVADKFHFVVGASLLIPYSFN